MELLSLADTLALLVDPSALVAEFLAATAAHVIAAHCLFNPELAERTLLELLALDEFHHLLFFFINGFCLLVLITSKSLVEGHSALKTVMLIALSALEFVNAFFKDECILAVGSRAPGEVVLLIN